MNSKEEENVNRRERRKLVLIVGLVIICLAGTTANGFHDLYEGIWGKPVGSRIFEVVNGILNLVASLLITIGLLRERRLLRNRKEIANDSIGNDARN